MLSTGYLQWNAHPKYEHCGYQTGIYVLKWIFTVDCNIIYIFCESNPIYN